MSNNIITKFIDNLSFFKLSGIKNYILLDIHKDNATLSFIEVKIPFYQITKTKYNDSIRIISSENFELQNDYSILTNKIAKLIKENNSEENFLVIGVNEFRFKTIKLSKDSEENEYWFDENTDKFLPEGRVSDEFIFSNEKYFEDEDNEFYFIVIARRNYIDSIVKACQIEKVKIINIAPFTLQIHPLKLNDNVLLLNFRNDKIIYSFSDSKQNIIHGETFLSASNNNFESDDNFNSFLLNGLNEIKQNLIGVIKPSEDTFSIYFTSFNSDKEQLVSLIKSVFTTEQVYNQLINAEDENILNSVVINNLLNGSDNSIYLSTSEIESENREILEKKTFLRIVLAFGITLILLLLTIYLGENAINSVMLNNENQLVEVDSKTKMLTTYRNENTKLRSNLSMLGNLKGKRIIYSNLLSTLSEELNNKSCFTDLSITEKDNSLDIQIEGLAYSQQDVTEMIKNIEGLENVKNVSLDYANSVERSKYKNKVWLPKSTMIDFSFSVKYYDN